MIEHMYLSTACFHGRHTDCRVTCKTCREQCVCLCHIEEEPTDDQYTNAILAYERHTRRRPVRVRRVDEERRAA